MSEHYIKKRRIRKSYGSNYNKQYWFELLRTRRLRKRSKKILVIPKNPLKHKRKWKWKDRCSRHNQKYWNCL